MGRKLIYARRQTLSQDSAYRKAIIVIDWSAFCIRNSLMVIGYDIHVYASMVDSILTLKFQTCHESRMKNGRASRFLILINFCQLILTIIKSFDQLSDQNTGQMFTNYLNWLYLWQCIPCIFASIAIKGVAILSPILIYWPVTDCTVQV